MIKQKEMLETMRETFEVDAIQHYKFTKVFARPAEEGEIIETITSDGKETQNTAFAHDMVVQNTTEAREEYIMPKEKFMKRYKKVGGTNSEGYDLYQATGECLAVEIDTELAFALGCPMEFEAPWGEGMILKKGDMLASDLDYTEVYRIARKEFYETYKPV